MSEYRPLIAVLVLSLNVLAFSTCATVAQSPPARIGFIGSLSGSCDGKENAASARDAFIAAVKSLSTIIKSEVFVRDATCRPDATSLQVQTLMEQNRVEFIFAYTQQISLDRVLKDRLFQHQATGFAIVFLGQDNSEAVKAGAAAAGAWNEVLNKFGEHDRIQNIKQVNELLHGEFWKRYSGN